MNTPRVCGLQIYPIKACGGISVEQTRVTRRGLTDDRRYMLVDQDGRFISQREEPGLCRVRLLEDGPHGLRIETENLQTSLHLPRLLEHGLRATVSVWRSEIRGVLVHPEGSAWFSRLLGMPVRLVFMGEE